MASADGPQSRRGGAPPRLESPEAAGDTSWWTRPLPPEAPAGRAHIGTWDLDLTTGEAQWSEEEYRLLGYEPGAVAATVDQFMAAVHPEDREAVRREMAWARSAAVPRPYHIEHRVVWPDGSVRHLDQRARVLFTPDGRPLRLVGSTLDVTERRTAEAFLRRLAGVLTSRLHGQARNLADLMEQVDAGLTQRLELQKGLEASERTLRTLMDNAGDAILVADRDTGTILEANHAAGTLLGRPAEDLVGRSQGDLHPQELAEEYRALFQDHLRHDRARVLEAVVQRADGTRIPVEISSARVDLVERSLAVGIFRDISDRARVEAELARRSDILDAVARLSQAFLRAARWEEVIGAALTHLGEATGASRAYLFSVHPGEPGGWHCSMSHEWCAPGIEPQIHNPLCQGFDFAARGVAAWHQALARGQPVARRASTYLPAEAAVFAPQDIDSVLMVPVFAEDALAGFLGFDDCGGERDWAGPAVAALESAAGVLGAAMERQAMGGRLADRERRYALATEAGQVGVWEWRAETNEVYADPVLHRMVGVAEGADTRDLGHWLAPLHPEDEARLRRLAEAIQAGAAPAIDLDVRVRLPGGGERWLAVRGDPGTPGLTPRRVYGTAADVTERRHMEDALRRANATWRETFDAVPDPIAVLDRDHRVVSANRALGARLGQPAAVLAGQDWYPLIHGRDEPPPGCPHRALMADGMSHSAEFAATRLGGYFRITASPLRDEAGTVRGSVCLAHDLTERQQAEADRLDGAERQRDVLVREVHHRIKNHLQGLVGLLRLRGGAAPACRRALDEAVVQVETIAAVYGMQSRRQGADVSLRETLAAIVASAAALQPVPIRVVAGDGGGRDCLIARDKAVAVALIINELLLNGTKGCHDQGPDDDVRVTVGCGVGQVHLRVSNPGRLPPGFDFGAGRGLGTGLQLLRDLVPRRGARLTIVQDHDQVVAELVMAYPLVVD